jgi:RHS repeat-associated protein
VVAAYLNDRQGSVRDLMGWGSQTVIDHLDYDGFGQVTETAPTVGDRYKYTGREYDADTGLQYNRARQYRPATGTWTSEDLLGLGPDSNPYRYVGNDPTNVTDPFGLRPPVATPGFTGSPPWRRLSLGRGCPQGSGTR